MNSRARFVAAVLVLTLLTLGGAFSAVYFAFNRLQERQLDEALLAAAAVEAQMLSHQPAEVVELSNRPGPAANQVGPLSTLAFVLDASGLPLAVSRTLRGRALPVLASGQALMAPFDLWIHNQHARGVWARVPGRSGMRLFFGVSRQDLDGDAAFLFRAMAVAFLVAVVWAAAVAYGIVRVFTDEQRRIAAVARSVADGNLSARVSSRSRDRDVATFAHDIDQMIERLALLVSSQQRFIAYAAHELRSPLTTLYGELSHALRKSRSAEEYRSAIEEALASTKSLKQLSEDLLELARVGAASNAPVERMAMRDIVESAVSFVRAEASALSVEVAVDCDRIDGAGHPRDVERLLRNLIENAVRHSPRGEHVQIRVRAKDEQIEMAVIDRGEGVDEADRERIFEPFYRAPREASRETSGAGLGLAIAREIARAHGGTVRVERGSNGVGAAFVATIRRELA